MEDGTNTTGTVTSAPDPQDDRNVPNGVDVGDFSNNQVTETKPVVSNNASASNDVNIQEDNNDEENADIEKSSPENEAEEKKEETTSKDDMEKNAEAVPVSEAAKRQNMIETELNGMIDEMMKSEEFEEEDEMEKESYEALIRAAKEICYTRKYYDVSSDKIIFFPSIIKTAVNMDLFEKAEEYYFDEDDEFPTDYSMGLRTIAFDRMEAEGDADSDDEELDDDMMERLSMAVQLTEGDLDEIREALAAAEAEDEEEATEESEKVEDASIPLVTIDEGKAVSTRTENSFGETIENDSSNEEGETEPVVSTNASTSNDVNIQEDNNDEENADVETSSPENESEEKKEETTSKDDMEKNAEAVPVSEASKRQNMIDTELNGMIDEMMKSEEFEEEDEMEKESYEALMRAAKEICYTRKYYDVSSDKIIFFPSIIKTVVNMDLFEKAEEYYFDEDDEFPTDYSMGLRTIAFDRMEAEGDADSDDEELDDDMMERLSMAVQLNEGDLDEIREALAAAEAENEEEAAEESEKVEDASVPLGTIDEGKAVSTAKIGFGETVGNDSSNQEDETETQVTNDDEPPSKDFSNSGPIVSDSSNQEGDFETSVDTSDISPPNDDGDKKTITNDSSNQEEGDTEAPVTSDDVPPLNDVCEDNQISTTSDVPSPVGAGNLPDTAPSRESNEPSSGQPIEDKGTRKALAGKSLEGSGADIIPSTSAPGAFSSSAASLAKPDIALRKKKAESESIVVEQTANSAAMVKTMVIGLLVVVAGVVGAYYGTIGFSFKAADDTSSLPQNWFRKRTIEL